MKRVKKPLFDYLRGGIMVLLVGGTALFVTRFTFNSFELPKNVWIRFFTLALVCLYASSLLFGRSVRLMFSPINLFLAAYLVVHLISGIAAESPSLWRDEANRIFCLFVFGLLLQDYLYGNRRRLFILIWALCLSSAIIASWTVIQDFGSKFHPQLLSVRSRLSDWRGFLASGLGNSGYIADYLAVLFPMNILLYLHVRGKPKEIFVLFTLLMSFAALVVCWSVQSNAGLILAMLILLFYLWKYKPKRFWIRRKIRIGVMLLGFFLITAFYCSPLSVNPHKPSIVKQAFSSERWHYGGESRLVIWSQSLEIIRKHAWLGCGAGNFVFQYVQQASPYLDNPKRLHYIGQYCNAAHNELLQSWAELGILGPAVLFLILVLVLRALLKHLEEESLINRWVRIGTFCVIVCSFFPAMMAYPLRLPASSLLFFVICSVPVVLLPRGAFARERVHIPVEFSWGLIHLTIILENFHKPVGSVLEIKVSRQWARIGTLFIIFCFLPWGFQTVRPIVSDTLFKQGRTLIEAHRIGLVDEKGAEKGERLMKKALVWLPRHHDCRSTLGQSLYRKGHYEEAIYHLYITLERLQAREIYETLGKSLDALGKTGDAVMAYEIFFSRNPMMIFLKPKLYERYTQLKSTTDNKNKSPSNSP